MYEIYSNNKNYVTIFLLLKDKYTCDSMFHTSIKHGSSPFHGSEARKTLAHMHCTRKNDIFRTLFMGFSSIHVLPYVMGFFVPITVEILSKK